MARMIFHRLATKEYEEGRRWYTRRSLQAAQRFQEAIDRAVQKIAQDPRHWPIYTRQFHWVRVAHFPFVLYYHILTSDRILVMAVAHARRRPGYWRRRAWS